MKQYTTPAQTAKLIELGFAPKARIKEVQVVHSEIQVSHDCSYTIGELIEMLPMKMFLDGERYDLEICPSQNSWVVEYIAMFTEKVYRSCSKSLVDALYKMILKLKAKGVI